jgi:competence protein ComEA
MSLNNEKPSSKAGQFFNGWKVVVILLIVIIFACSIIIWLKHSNGRGIEISFEPEEKPVGQIYVSGEVNNPGLYALHDDDSIDNILKAAGGLTGNADPERLELTAVGQGEKVRPQKVDINRAEAWLLAALPGIGETRAQSIIAYRRVNGPFRDINELLKVPGMGNATFEGVKNLITVSE